MKITLLGNHELASAYALLGLRRVLHEHQLTVFYTNKSSRRQRPRALVELQEFDQRQLRQLNLFEDLSSHCLNDINGQDFTHYQASDPDLVISVRHMTILQQTVIDLPKFGVINLHSGLLPGYQGVMATFWAMLNQDSQMGTSLHWIQDKGIDTGSLISTNKQAIDYTSSYLLNVLALYQDGISSIKQTVHDLEYGKPVRCDPQQGKARYYSWPKQSHLDIFPYPLYRESDVAVITDMVNQQQRAS